MAIYSAQSYILKIRHYIIFSALIYAVSLYAGYYFAATSPEAASRIFKDFSEMFGPIEKIPLLELAILIFLKNSLAAFLSVFFGLIFGFLPLLGLFTNGAILGIFAYIFFQKYSLVAMFFAGILPHGIIEIPAFIFSAASGLYLGVAAMRRLIFGERKLRAKFSEAMSFFFFALLPLLFIAAFIEAFITPVVISLFDKGAV